MKLSRAHLELITDATKTTPGEIDVAIHPSKRLIVMEVSGGDVLVMEPEAVDHLIAKLQYVRGQVK